MAGGEIPEVTGDFLLGKAFMNGGLFIAMFDCWRVSNVNWFMLPHPTTKLQI
jgi:hypothetical protein